MNELANSLINNTNSYKTKRAVMKKTLFFFMLLIGHFSFSQAGRIEDYQLKYLPYLWANYDELQGKTKVLFEAKGTETNVFNIPTKDTSEGNYIEITLENTPDVDTEILLEYGGQREVYGTYRFSLSAASKGKYKIRVSSQYNWYAKEINFVSVKGLPEGAKISSLRITTAD